MAGFIGEPPRNCGIYATHSANRLDIQGIEELQLTRFAAQVLNRTDDDPSVTWRIWKLIPVKAEGAPTPSQSSTSETPGSGSLPPYHLDADGQCPTQTLHSERENDDFGTIVTEVTTITTRKRYRVEGA